MIYEPKVIFNSGSEPVEFMQGGQIHIFKPGEKKMLDGFVAHHVLREMNGPLKEYEPGTDDESVSSTNIAYDKMKWGKLVQLASERGIFKPGMDKAATVKALIEADE